MTHLTRDELVRWRDTGAADDRARVLTHLAACGECRSAYADLVRLEPESIPAGGDDLNVFVHRGIGAYDSRNAPAQSKRRWLWAAVPLAAAAMVILAINVRQADAPFNAPSADVRGTAITAQAPAGLVDRVTEFRWTSSFDASRYRVSVRDAQDREVLARETASADRLVLDLPLALPAGRYAWLVEARDQNGKVMKASRPQAFQVH